MIIVFVRLLFKIMINNKMYLPRYQTELSIRV